MVVIVLFLIDNMKTSRPPNVILGLVQACPEDPLRRWLGPWRREPDSRAFIPGLPRVRYSNREPPGMKVVPHGAITEFCPRFVVPGAWNWGKFVLTRRSRHEA